MQISTLFSLLNIILVCVKGLKMSFSSSNTLIKINHFKVNIFDHRIILVIQIIVLFNGHCCRRLIQQVSQHQIVFYNNAMSVRLRTAIVVCHQHLALITGHPIGLVIVHLVYYVRSWNHVILRRMPAHRIVRSVQ